MPERPQVPRWIPAMFHVASVANWLIATPSAVAPRRAAAMFGAPEPEPPFPTQAWSGMAVMFGFMFREIAADPVAKRALIRYGWAEKLVSATAITIGYRAGDAPRSALALLTLSDWALILPFAYAKRRLDAIAEESA
jgi:hypothetical protein